VLGAGLLWFGWFGFNGADGLQANGVAAQALINTQVAAAAAMLVWLLIEHFSGKTALIEAVTPRLTEMGLKVLIITNDVVTTEDARHVQRTLKGVLIEDRIVGVETGACPHTAVREDPSMNLAAVEEMEQRFPDGDVVLIESGGDNLTLTFSPALADFFIYVIDVAAGDKIPRKDGPGISQSDILVINKTDLAPYVHASLKVMAADSRLMRSDKPFVFTNCVSGEGIAEVMALIRRNVLFDVAPAQEPGR
jgi:urease accessory protein